MINLSNNGVSESDQVNYTRWLCFCHVPAFCDSMPHFDISLIFGKDLLKSIFEVSIKFNSNRD
jgi:histone acetyltransferase